MGKRLKVFVLGGAFLAVAGALGIPLLVRGGEAGEGELLESGPGVTFDAKLISTGEEVEIEDYLRPGVTTLIEFTAESSPDCRAVASKLEALARRHRFRLRTIDVGELGSPVAEQYGIGSLPAAWLYRGDDLIEDDYKAILYEYGR